MGKLIRENHETDGIDRRGFLECMAWAGTGALISFSGGVAHSQTLHGEHMAKTDLQFVQISDSHIGFNKDANKDVAGTLQEAVNRINALPEPPAFLLHTGDITHLSKPEEFDTARQILKGCKAGDVFYVPGEHDVLPGSPFEPKWYSFDQKGVHFIGLVNVLETKPGGLGSFGNLQLEWLAKDLKGLSASTPIVVFAHVPLWTVYQDWGWGTGDGVTALSYLQRFGSVTVLNGHIHQTMQKIEGNITFHTASSTAFPQPKPGSAPSPGPMKVPSDQLRSLLGLTEVSYVRGSRQLALIDETLAGTTTNEVRIDNFAFSPGSLKAARGTEIRWTNHDDIPHNIVARDKSFASPVLDTDETFKYRFEKPGEYEYYCSLHPKMTARATVLE